GHPTDGARAHLLRPLVNATGKGIVGRQLRETQRHHELATKDRWPGPEERRAAGGKAQVKHLEHAGEDRKIGETGREAGEAAEQALECLLVTEGGEILAVATSGLGHWRRPPVEMALHNGSFHRQGGGDMSIRASCASAVVANSPCKLLAISYTPPFPSAQSEMG